jgi:hypothetical protein
MNLGDFLLLAICLPFALIYFWPSSLKAAFKWSPYSPTGKNIIRKALKAVGLRPGETMYDLGAGDCRSLVIAEKEFRAEAIGVEYAFPFYLLGRLNLVVSGVKMAKVLNQDLFKTDISSADVLFLYLTSKVYNQEFKSKLEKELKKGARVISFSTPLGFWQPSKIIPLEEEDNKINLYLYNC